MICTALTEWMDKGYVDIRNYHEDFHLAITAQNKIGWRNFFAGKISQHWLNLHDSFSNNKSKHSQSYVWGASIVETTLRLMIDLWNLRNEEVHGKTVNEREQKRKHRLLKKIDECFAKITEMRPSDRCLMPENRDDFVESSTSNDLAEWLASHQKMINNSIEKWKKRSEKGTRNIGDWLKTVSERNKEILENIYTRHRDRLMHDAWNKKKRHKAESLEHRTRATLRQRKLNAYLT